MEKRICVILPCNIFEAPFYRRYESLIHNLKFDFDLIIWDRAGISEEANAKIISFNSYVVSNNGDKSKIFKFIKFALFTKKIIKKNKYDKIIILGSYSGTMAFLSLFLYRKYRKNYWLDIRDYTYEWFKPYCKAMEIVIRNSNVTTISSHAYKIFLPKNEYSYFHNYDIDSIEQIIASSKKDMNANKTRISFIGNIRYYDENIKLLNALKNDNRFILQYYGSGSEILQEYCIKNGIENTEFAGRFPSKQTAEFYNKTDIINNVYGNSGIELTTALSNKLYYSLALVMPILVSPNTYMEKITKTIGIGFTVNFQYGKIGNDLYEFYKQFNEKNNEIKKKCEQYLSKIFNEDKSTVALFTKYLQQ